MFHFTVPETVGLLNIVFIYVPNMSFNKSVSDFITRDLPYPSIIGTQTCMSVLL